MFIILQLTFIIIFVILFTLISQLLELLKIIVDNEKNTFFKYNSPINNFKDELKTYSDKLTHINNELKKYDKKKIDDLTIKRDNLLLKISKLKKKTK